MQVHHVDIKAAYLNGKLDKIVYMRQPYMYEEGGGEWMCQLHKAISGLKQSARCWHRRLTGALKKIGSNMFDQTLVSIRTKNAIVSSLSMLTT